jgi:glutathione S-transferase
MFNYELYGLSFVHTLYAPFLFQLTLADIYFFDVVSRFLERFGNVLEKFPKLAANLKKTENSPKIAEYLTKRPKTEL